eukprot:TRINITY_DN34994_c0_g1_i1.p1 TRINITY_DN34994_c0_g1~~TRINITY_DN34994_c0_g1_i1.p1  ORF type:complete len:146 (+),score=29.03 TRINITY_DN34994_c0_g1_i1:48-485(+)
MGAEWRAFYQSSALPETGHVEDRTDTYFVGLGIDKGLKARHGTRMELKTCVKRKGEVEYWEKSYKTDDIDTSSLHSVKVSKRRFYKEISSVKNTEVVNIRVNGTSWVSVAVEGFGVEAAAAKVKKALPENAFIGGYPAWLESLAK